MGQISFNDLNIKTMKTKLVLFLCFLQGLFTAAQAQDVSSVIRLALKEFATKEI